jgi:excisionase family DNA binding protein
VSNDQIMTVRELAEYLKIAEKTAYRFALEGKVPAFKVGGAWRFRKAEVDRWIKEQELNNKKSDGGNAL